MTTVVVEGLLRGSTIKTTLRVFETSAIGIGKDSTCVAAIHLQPLSIPKAVGFP